MDKETRNLILIVGVAAFAVYYVKKIAGAAGAAFDATGSWIGGQLYEWAHPSAEGESLYYVVLFPTNEKHAIASGDIRSDGTFTYQGNAYRMRTDASGNHVAVMA